MAADTGLVAVQAQADRLLARIRAGRGVSPREADAFRRRVAELPRDVDAIPAWRFRELDAAVREVVGAAAAPVPEFRAARVPTPRRSASPARRENPRLAALRARVERCERTTVLSCDLVNLEAALKVQRSARRMSAEDVRQVDELVRRVQAHARRKGGAARVAIGRRRSSEGHGFVADPAVGAARLAAGEMAHGPRTPNKGRPARTAWAFGAGLPTLGKR